MQNAGTQLNQSAMEVIGFIVEIAQSYKPVTGSASQRQGRFVLDTT